MERATERKLRADKIRAEISDDDRWKQVIEQARDLSPRLVEMLEKQRQSLIEKREQGSTLFDEEDSERAVQAEVERVLPLLIARRKESGETGPVTLDEMHLAEASAFRAGSPGHLEMMRQHIQAETDPQRKAHLREALESIEKGFGRLTESDFDRVNQRAAELSKEIFPPKN